MKIFIVLFFLILQQQSFAQSLNPIENTRLEARSGRSEVTFQALDQAQSKCLGEMFAEMLDPVYSIKNFEHAKFLTGKMDMLFDFKAKRKKVTVEYNLREADYFTLDVKDPGDHWNFIKLTTQGFPMVDFDILEHEVFESLSHAYLRTDYALKNLRKKWNHGAQPNTTNIQIYNYELFTKGSATNFTVNGDKYFNCIQNEL